MKEKVMMVGPLPPPPGGVATLMQILLDSSLSDRYTISVFDIARKKRKYRTVDGGGISSVYYLALNLVKLGYRLYKEKPVIVHIQAVTGLALLRDLCFMVLGKLWRKKVVFHLHGFYSEGIPPFRYSVTRRLSQFLMERVDILVLLANAFVPEFDSFLPKTKKIVVPNLMPRNAAEKPGDIKMHTGSEVNVLFVGRLSRLKGTYDLLKAACFLKKENVRFLLAGLGDTREDEERIAAQISENGLENKVELLGYVEGQKKVELFENSDILVLPSYTEVFPVVIIEAMAAGMPVIATPVGAVPDIIRDGVNGFIVPPGECNLLAEKIRWLAQNPEKRIEMGRNNLERFESEYRVETNIYRIDRIYQDIL